MTGLPQDPAFYAVTIVAVILLGLAKGGFAGMGILAMPIMSLAMSPLQAGAILLPVLLAQDAVTVGAYWRGCQPRLVLLLVIGGALGVFLAYLLASRISLRMVEVTVGGITVLFALQRILKRVPVADKPPSQSSLLGIVTGICCGFCSQLVQAGAPPFHMYMLSQRVPSGVYLGTAAVFFTLVDIMKVPAFFALGEFSRETLTVSLWLLPLAAISSWVGVLLVRRLPIERFHGLVTAMLLVVGSVLLLGR